MPGKDESRTVDSICVTGEDKEIVKSHLMIIRRKTTVIKKVCKRGKTQS